MRYGAVNILLLFVFSIYMLIFSNTKDNNNNYSNNNDDDDDSRTQNNARTEKNGFDLSKTISDLLVHCIV